MTTDARLIHMGKEIDHPSGVPAHEIVLVAPLVNGQKILAQELQLGVGTILPLTRSSIAQIGLELDPQKVQVMGSLIGVEGYVLSANGDISDRLVDRIQAMERERMVVNLGRVGLLPDNARVNQRRRVSRARDRGRLVSNDMAVAPDATLLFPLGSTSHVLRPEATSAELLDRILLGKESGRKALNDTRIIEKRPDFLYPGEFLVTEIDIGTQAHHVVLQPEIVDVNGEETDVCHLFAFLLEAGRTQNGIRHAEVWNRGTKPVDLRRVRIRADLYRPAEVQQPGH